MPVIRPARSVIRSARSLTGAVRCHAGRRLDGGPRGGVDGGVGRDAGTTIPLLLGFFVIAGAMVTGAIAASSAFNAQRDLAGLCDSAALAAADAVDARAVYAGGAALRRLPLDTDGARAAARQFVRGSFPDDPGPPARVLAVTVSGPGNSVVTVRCRRTGVQVPFGAVVGLGDGITRTATASARSPLTGVG